MPPAVRLSYREVQREGGRLFSLRLDADSSIAKLIVREADGGERVLFDPASESGVPVSQ
jgi:hypothetical protein